jgi:hypothetical protein
MKISKVEKLKMRIGRSSFIEHQKLVQRESVVRRRQ